MIIIIIILMMIIIIVVVIVNPSFFHIDGNQQIKENVI